MSLKNAVSKFYLLTNNLLVKQKICLTKEYFKNIYCYAFNHSVYQKSITKSSFQQIIGKRLKEWSLKTRNEWLKGLLCTDKFPLIFKLHKKFMMYLLSGDVKPFFALIGISLASSSGVISNNEELELACWKIQETVSKLPWVYNDSHWKRVSEIVDLSVKSLAFGNLLGKGCNAAVYSASWIKEQDSIHDYPLAVKVMFNYGIESNAASIFHSMQKEMIPCQKIHTSTFRKNLSINFLPPHPFIVNMKYAFVDMFMDLPDCQMHFPEALPNRLNSKGYGRNMSLYLVMKRYNCTLKQFLNEYQLTFHTRLMILAQLLEALIHLKRNGIAHRDLKADNILVDISAGIQNPILAITDFGCCLQGFILPYSSTEIDLGGNRALMAPEISRNIPGTFKSLNYSKADLWAVGTLVYEIFDVPNPFSTGNLDSLTYFESDLPDLPYVPLSIQALCHSLLCINPKKRLSAEVAAGICQLLLWAPPVWFCMNKFSFPSQELIIEWLLSLTVKICLQSHFEKGGLSSDFLLLFVFLSRVRLSEVMQAVHFILQSQ